MAKYNNLKMHQVALSNFVYYRHSLSYTLDSLERIGARAIELYAAAPHFCLEDCSVADMKALRRKIDDHHLKVINVCPENCTYPMNMASRNREMAIRTYRNYVRAIQAASELECPHVLCFPGLALADECPEDAWKRAIDAMTQLADVAAGYGVTNLLEASGSGVTVLDGTCKTVQMLKEINSPGLTGMVDLMCIEIVGDSIESAIEQLGIDRVGHIHFSDAVEVSPGHWEHRVPGDGTINIEHDLEVLNAHKFDAYFGCEVFAPYEADPELAMRRYLDWCRERFVQD